MSERAGALASRFEAENDGMIATVEGCSDSQWQMICAGEQRPVAVVAHHVAAAYKVVCGWVETVATGQTLPELTHAKIDEINAKHATRFASPTRDDTLALLRSGGAAAASMVRGFSDEQLDRTGTMPLFDGYTLTAEQVIKRVLIGHARGHHADIVRTLGG
jgi:hypothetical protein